MLEIKNITVHYDKFQALRDISLDLKKGELIVLIGSNGSGKSTIIKAICGLAPPSSGSISFFGERIDLLPPNKIVERGIACVPEGRRIFPQMTIRENLMMGSFLKSARKRRDENIKNIFKMFPRLEERQIQSGGTLSGGEQQMLAIGRALMSEPKLLLMDEPSLGLAPIVVQQLSKIIGDIHKIGISIVLVEQNARFGLKLADRGYVLETGHIALEGSSQDLLNNEHIKRTYLGI